MAFKKMLALGEEKDDSALKNQEKTESIRI